jgi:hypothetical protein
MAPDGQNETNEFVTLFEFHDQPWFPGFLRHYVTDSLQGVLALGSIYRGSTSRLSSAFRTSKAVRIVDLCSGGSGPWPWLYPAIRDPSGRLAEICLTDLYPNQAAFEQLHRATQGAITYWPESVDATRVPVRLRGFRTIFSSFHHFSKPDAVAILQGAVNEHQGIGVFEVARRDPITMILTTLMFLGALATAPFIKPFRFSRLFWTYVLPVVPFLLFWDGLISCLRAYSAEDLEKMAADLDADNYTWHVGEDRSGCVRVTYLLGIPA